MALQPRFVDFPARERPAVPGADQIAQLKDSAEIRYIALGKHYSAMSLPQEQLREVEKELRQARMYEHLVTAKTMRQAELDEQRRRVAEEAAKGKEQEQQRMLEVQMLRQRALSVLHEQAEAVRRHEQEQLVNDRRALLHREKERLLDRRRRFELEYSEGGGGVADLSGGSPRGGAGSSYIASSSAADRSSGPLRNRDQQPVAVMSVALGNGREGRIVVRQYDDPKRVATLFVKKHQLPEHVVHSLTQQIEANLTASLHHRSKSLSLLRAQTPPPGSSARRLAGGGSSAMSGGGGGGGGGFTPATTATSLGTPVRRTDYSAAGRQSGTSSFATPTHAIYP